MRSRLTCSPAARAHATTCGIRSGSCVRSSVASTCGTADCIPKLTRVKPGRRRARRGCARRPSRGSPRSSPRRRARDPRCSGCRRAGSRGRRPAAGWGFRRRRTPCRRGAGRSAGRGEHALGLRDLGERLPGVVALLHPADLGRRVGVEVAVSAAHLAERHVHVDPERRARPSRRRPSPAAARQRAPDRRSAGRRASCDSRRARLS